MKEGKYNKNNKTGAGIMDDADTTDVGGGSSSLIHGVMVDSLTRALPTHLTSFKTRNAVMQWAAQELPWVDPNAAVDTAVGAVPDVDSVATRLQVTVADATNWKYGTPEQKRASRFGNFTDVPFNPETMARLNFWALDQDAAELDPTIQLEPQAVAVDAFSQLFAESAAFHFGFLTDLDNEYHRLREFGPVGVLNETAQLSPWYHLYHYWRNQVEEAYLNSGLVQLPVGAQQANWRIIDVLKEITRLMSTDGKTLLPDIFLSAKGVSKGQTTSGFGLLGDEAYLDADGNSRFYIPWMEAETQFTSNFNIPLTYEVLTDVESTDATFVGNDPRYMDGSAASNRTWDRQLTNATNLGNGDITVVTDGDAIRPTSYYPRAIVSLMSHLSGDLHEFNPVAKSATAADGTVTWYPGPFIQGAVPVPAMDGYMTNDNGLHFGADHPWNALTNVNALHRSPHLRYSDSRGAGTGAGASASAGILYSDGVAYTHWTGHSLNLVDLIAVARRLGRTLESDVAESLLPMLGLIGSVSDLDTRGTGMGAAMVPKLYNLYGSSFSFNENPIRTFTAAHAGPSDLRLPNGAPGDEGVLDLEGNILHTEQGGQVLTIRERYWTPPTVSAADATATMAALFAGANYTFGIAGVHSLADLGQWDGLHRGFVGRALGTNSSMLQKVEKPTILPAGVSDETAVYASGVGRGVLELALELVYGSIGAVPRFGLGMSGFSDVAVDGAGEFVSRLEAAGDVGLLIVGGIDGSAISPGVTDALIALPGGFDNASLEASATVRGQDDVETRLLGLTNSALKPLHVFNGQAGVDSNATWSGDLFAGDPGVPEEIRPFVLSNTGAGPLMRTVSTNATALNHVERWGLPFMDNLINSAWDPTSLASGDVFMPGAPVDIHIVPTEVVFFENADGAMAWGADMTTGELNAGDYGAYHVVPIFEEATFADKWNTYGPGVTDSANMLINDGNAIGYPFIHQQSSGAFTTAYNYAWVTTGASGQGVGSEGTVRMWYPKFTPEDAISAAANRMLVEANAGVINLDDALQFTRDGDIHCRIQYSVVMTCLEDANIPGQFQEVTWRSLNTGNLPSGNGADPADGCWTWGRWFNAYTLTPGVRNDVFDYTGLPHAGDAPSTLPFSLVGEGVIEPAIGNEFTFAPTVTPLEGMTVSYAGGHYIRTATSGLGYSDYEAWITAHLPLQSGVAANQAACGLSYENWSGNNGDEGIRPPVEVGGIVSYMQTTLFSAPERLHSTVGASRLDLRLGVDFEYWELGPITSGQYLTPFYTATQLLPLHGAPTENLTMARYRNRNYGAQTSGWRGAGMSLGAFGLATPQGLDYSVIRDPANSFFGSGIFASGFPAHGTGLIEADEAVVVGGLSVGDVPDMVTGAAHPDLSIDWSQVSFMYPDDPQHKMLYRPWRTYVDAAIAKELRYTFPNRGDHASSTYGELGVEVIGTHKEFRFDELIRAGMENTFLLEKASSKSRMVNKDNRGILVFTKTTMLDPQTLRHVAADELRAMSTALDLTGVIHKAAYGGSKLVYTKDNIRAMQLGRQMNRQR